MDIRIRERSKVRLSASQFRMLQQSPALNALINSKVLEVYLGDGGAWLKSGAHVGSARINPDLTLEIYEKISGSLDSLQSALLPPDIKVVKTPSFAGTGRFIDRVCAVYANALGAYLSFGAKKLYRPEELISYFPRGRIDVSKTSRLWAKGKRPTLVSRRQNISTENDLNRLLKYAANLSEGVLSECVDPDALTMIRRYSVSLSCSVQGYRADAGAIDDALDMARSHSQAALDAAHLAAAICNSLSPVFANTNTKVVPLAVFASLEDLFERAVRSVLKARYDMDGHRTSRPLFADRLGQYGCFPDYVVRAQKHLLLGDAKYKELENGPDNADVYQLIAHMDAYQAVSGFLIYPSLEYGASKLGTTNSGRRICIFSVRPTFLAHDIEQALGEMLREEVGSKAA